MNAHSPTATDVVSDLFYLSLSSSALPVFQPQQKNYGQLVQPHDLLSVATSTAKAKSISQSYNMNQARCNAVLRSCSSHSRHSACSRPCHKARNAVFCDIKELCIKYDIHKEEKRTFKPQEENVPMSHKNHTKHKPHEVFSGGPVVENPPANTGNGFDPGSEKIAHAMGKLSPCTTTSEPVP